MLRQLTLANKLDILKLNEIITELQLYLQPLQKFESVQLQLRKLIALFNKPTIVLSSEENEQKAILLISLVLMRISNTLRFYEMSDTYALFKKIIGIYPSDLEIMEYLKNIENQNKIDNFLNESVKESELQPVIVKKPYIFHSVVQQQAITNQEQPYSTKHNKFSFLPKSFYSANNAQEKTVPIENWKQKFGKTF